VTRPSNIDHLPVDQACRVSLFMQEAQVGRWKLQRFHVTQQEYARKRLVNSLNLEGHNPTRVAMAEARMVPPGDYLSLRRRMTVGEARDELSEFIAMHESLTGVAYSDDEIEALITEHDVYAPVMSDTPAEINEHGDALTRARGRVLIHGLGLGCLVSGLLAHPLVTHIDVVEVDPDVIEMVGPYYQDEARVTIHRGDCMTFPWPPDARWDYVWHDIWSHISDLNLDPETAEHGISYGMLFDRFDARCEAQGAWAFPEAVEMQRIRYAERERVWARNRSFATATHDERVAMLIEDMIRERTVGLGTGDPIPESVMEFWLNMEPSDGDLKLREYAEQAITRAEADGKFDLQRIEKWQRQQEAGHRPNDFITR
jgi:hypothetical protein